MNSPSNPMAESFAAAPAPTLAIHPFYWSVRRELWENRSIYLTPLGVAPYFYLAF